MNNKELIIELSNRIHHSQKDVTKLLDVTIKAISNTLENGKDVSIQGFGILQVKKKNERVIVNPSTQVKQIVPPKLTVNFKMSNTYKEKLKTLPNNGK